MKDTPWGDEALDLREAAAYCKYSDLTFRCEYKNWGTPHLRLAGRPVFLKGDLDKWMAGRERQRFGPLFKEVA